MSSARIQTDWASPVMQARVRRRYAKERRFRFLGLAALALAGSFLFFLLGTIFSDGYTGFLRTEVKLSVEYDAFELGIDRSAIEGAGGENALNTANFQGVMMAAATARAQSLGVAAKDIVSDGAWLALREAVRENPDLIGSRVDVWVPTSGDFDLLGKGLVERDVPEANRPVSDAEIAAFDRLKAEDAVRTTLNTTFLSMADSTSPELAGIWGAAKGSLLTLAVTLLLCFPIGVMTAIYLEEYAPKNRFTDLIEVSINNLAAVPSIIFGLLGLAVFLNFFGMPRSAPIVGGLTLALMTLPVIVIAGRIAMKSVPPSIRDAALGVGASQIQVVFHHVLPLALPGILTGTIIGMARALGETAPLLMIGMRAFVTDVPGGLTTPATVLPVQIFLWSDEVARGFVEKTSAAIMVLLVFLMLMNGLAIYLRNKFEKRW
ncbi:phosphate ABC transporter permease PstA [Sphingosinicella soli]|uniref:Phosphate transport system permease protein PstA n=1 Tax=Sphingosinicella soli TaxID=333708 RepID=A0A7W7B2U6_9SPHN|nr:phosphate ABC transporter permease PstA [Sphingosinicella soli]MBB4632996.1 phosphate transport system permease protein [Sphingosinicella soli]